MRQADSPSAPCISVIIPVYNGSQFFDRCLAAVFASDFESFEVIVVDDHSSDDSAAVARRFPCTTLKLPINTGPAAARNSGATEACGSILFFLDADILIKRNTLTLVAGTMARDAGLAALFGSYSKDTVPCNFTSRYKNLVHYYTHQRSREEATTFCSGFGAIRREAFRRLGGFNPCYRFLEDIELGYRMSRLGLRVRLCKNLQLTHCKHYSLGGLIYSDLFGRAVPWTRLMLETGIIRNDLNTRWNNVVSVPVSFLLLAAPALPAPLLSFTALLCLLVYLNAGLLLLTYSEAGLFFAFRSLLMCFVGYLYSALGVALGFKAHWKNALKSAALRSDPSK